MKLSELLLHCVNNSEEHVDPEIMISFGIHKIQNKEFYNRLDIDFIDAFYKLPIEKVTYIKEQNHLILHIQGINV